MKTVYLFQYLMEYLELWILANFLRCNVGSAPARSKNKRTAISTCGNTTTLTKRCSKTSNNSSNNNNNNSNGNNGSSGNANNNNNNNNNNDNNSNNNNDANNSYDDNKSTCICLTDKQKHCC